MRYIGITSGVFLVALLFTSSAHVSAQTSGIEGVVTDTQGGALGGVTVSASSLTTTNPSIAITDSAGRYDLPTLTPDTYTVTITLDGFGAAQFTDIVLVAGEVRTVNAQLALASLAEQVTVVGVAPLLGSNLNRDRVAANISTVRTDELETRGATALSDVLNERFGSITLEGATTNPFQPTLRYRGFTASPLLGLPQGIAVYQNGVRLNEPFGDTVQFDLMPQFAIDSLQLTAGSDPTYGLNALGGALALRLKNGFTNTGFRGEFSGGSFGRMSGTAEYGTNAGPWAVYVGATHFDETGWRTQSPSKVTQAVADIGYQNNRVDAGITFTHADTALNGNGAAPIELLAVSPSAVFTFPDITENKLAFLQGRFNLTVSPTWSVQAAGYHRDLNRQTLNGDEADFGVCQEDALPIGAPLNTLCQGTDDDDDELDSVEQDDDDDSQSVLVDTVSGRFITDRDARGTGAFNRTNTNTRGYGASLQATARSSVGTRENVLLIGVSADLADVKFSSNSEVGSLTTTRTIAGSGLFAGVYGLAPDDLFNTDLNTESSNLGVYATDTYSVTDRTHLTLSGRYNHTRINIVDNFGTSLNGRHTFSQFNPALGAVFDATSEVSIFGRYSIANRAPTAAELSCADPEEPCRVPNAFISDPPLEQAIARSAEAGLRGNVGVLGGITQWSLTAYQTRIDDDILFVASPKLIGTGYFQNAGNTRRAGIDLELNGTVNQIAWYASYGMVQATFESSLRLPGNSEVNAAATEDGTLLVEPGDRIPGIPRHSIKAGLTYNPTTSWNLALETIAGSSRVFLGDEGNDQIALPGYAIANLRTSYQLTSAVDWFARIDNLFNRTYATFGILAELEIDLDEVPNASDPRFIGPGAPRSAYTGFRVRF